MATAASAAASAMLSAVANPSLASDARISAFASKATTETPAFLRFRSIGRPIAPVPMNATLPIAWTSVVMACTSFREWCGGRSPGST